MPEVDFPTASPTIAISRDELPDLLDEISTIMRLTYADLVVAKPPQISVETREKFAQFSEDWWQHLKAWGYRGETFIVSQIDRIRRFVVALRGFARYAGEKGVAVTRVLSERLQRIADSARLVLQDAAAKIDDAVDDPFGVSGAGIAIAAALLLGVGAVAGSRFLR